MAPTPSGFLHVGNAYSLILTWIMARNREGQILLRIDDLDASRKRPEYVEDIFVTLEWLGLDYDEGPSGPQEFEQQFSQRHRLHRYNQVLETLWDTGTCFACECSRSMIQRNSLDGLYPGTCRTLAHPHDDPVLAWRILTPQPTPIQWDDVITRPQQVDVYATMRDFVVRRKGGLPAYQIASLVDDWDFGINWIVRGEDLLASTAAQRFLAEPLGISSFLAAQFAHHPIVKDEQGQKLSKSAGATSLRAMRKAHTNPTVIYRWLAKAWGLPTSISTLEELRETLKGQEESIFATTKAKNLQDDHI